MAIKLTKVDERRLVYRISLGGSVIDDLILYGEAYRQEHGQTLEPSRLMSSMVEEFMTEDKAFQRWKKSENSVSSAQDTAKLAIEPPSTIGGVP